MLVRLKVGDRLPWRVEDDEPQWLVVTEVRGEDQYEVEYPDGHCEVLTDSE